MADKVLTEAKVQELREMASRDGGILVADDWQALLVSHENLRRRTQHGHDCHVSYAEGYADAMRDGSRVLAQKEWTVASEILRDRVAVIDRLVANARAGLETRRAREAGGLRCKRAMTALAHLLVRIGSWTSSRWDQHVRHEYGDEVAEDLDRLLDDLGVPYKAYGETRTSDVARCSVCLMPGGACGCAGVG